jgi:hypothetical protein
MDAARISATLRHILKNNMKPIPFKTRILTVIFAVATSVAPANQAQAEKPAAVTPAAAELELAIKDAKKEQIRHSMAGPRNTLLFYTFAIQKAVLVLLIDNKSLNLTTSGTLHIFDPAATEDSISKWVDNQHSCGLFADAATPALSLKLPDGTFAVTERKFLNSIKQPPNAEVFSDYQVKITAKEHRVEDKYRLPAFTDEANVFVKVNEA